MQAIACPDMVWSLANRREVPGEVMLYQHAVDSWGAAQSGHWIPAQGLTN